MTATAAARVSAATADAAVTLAQCGEAARAFTCTEADSLATLLAVNGYANAAASFLISHSTGDRTREGDLHRTRTYADVAADPERVAPLTDVELDHAHADAYVARLIA